MDLILLPVYAASEEVIVGCDSEAMAVAIQNLGKSNVACVADFVEAQQEIVSLIRKDAVILTQGAGSVGRLIPDILYDGKAAQKAV